MRFFNVIRISLFIHLAVLVYTARTQTVACNSQTTVQYTCNDQKSCIQRGSFCNNVTDCPDGSDEFVYDKAIHQSLGIPCKTRDDETNKICLLPNKYLCDFEVDCDGGNDECGCNHTFQCKDGNCTVKPSFCDHQMDCPDNTDEEIFDSKANIGFQCPVTKLHTSQNCILPNQYVCDGESDCDYGIDECFCNFTDGIKKGTYIKDIYSNDECFRCLDGTLIIPNIHVCDGVVHCQDLSDECICNEANVKLKSICNSVCKSESCGCPGQLQCIPMYSTDNSTTCVNQTSICDNVHDCQNRMDENYCYAIKDTELCKDNKTRIKKFLFCNGNDDCEDKSDESSCVEDNNYYCAYYRGAFPSVTDWNNASITIPPGSLRSFFLCPSHCSEKERILEFDQPLYARKCDGVPTCSGLSDECNAGCTPTPEFCQYSASINVGFKCASAGSVIIGKQICDGKPTCNSSFPNFSEDEMDCPNRFYCEDRGSSRLPIHLPEKGRCDGRTECYDKSDELNCSAKTHFYCGDNGVTLFVRNTQVCDGKQDCEGGSDECNNCRQSSFSSDEKLISNRVLIVFLWIISLFAVVGNCAVIGNQIRNLIKPIGTPSTIVISNRILVLNLSTADLLVGIYLLSLGIKDATISRYCKLDQEWRSSATCSALGVIAVIGTESCVFILTIMTAYRLYLVVRPFQQQKRTFIQIAILVAWIIAIILALIPLTPSLQDYFMSCVWFRNHPFIGYTCKRNLSQYIQNLEVYQGANQTFSSSVGNGYTWDSMFAAMAKFNESYVPERYYGYYSANSVCLPRLFPDRAQDESWGYSLFLILLNFFALVFILVSYIIIYRSAAKRTQRSRAVSVSSEDRTLALQRKVTRIVITDFCCWLPICIMAFIKVSGGYVSGEAYTVTAIILIPINSAMNPFLYSDILDMIWEEMMPIRNWFNGTLLGKEVERRRTMRSNKSSSERSADHVDTPL